MRKDLPAKLVLWALGDDTGLSSKFLARAALGPVPRGIVPDYPRDAGDFGRCYRLAKVLGDDLMPALKNAATVSGKWAIVRDNWHELVSLYEDSDHKPYYRRTRELGL